VLKSAVINSVTALLASGACFAAIPAISEAAADETVMAVTDDAQLDEIVDATDVDHGAKDDVDMGAQDNVNNEAMNETNVDTGAADAIEGQQDATEATQEHAEQGGQAGDSGPSG
jgi:hypothetical protein